MRKSVLILFVLSVLFTLSFSSSILNNFDNALKLAKIEHRMSIIMFSSTGCPYCVKFIKESYPDKTVQELIMNNFVFAELNEKSSEIHFEGKTLTYGQLAQGFGIRGTPSFVFFTYNSTPITVLPGYVPADIFSKALKYIAQELYSKNVSFKDYMNRRDPYIGIKNIIKVSSKDADFILKNDIYAKSISNINQAKDKYTHYVVSDKDLANNLLKNGFYNIFLINQ